MMPVFGVMALGFVVRRLNWLTEEADHSLLRLVVNLLIPAFILDTVLGNDALRRPENLFIPPLLGFLNVAIGLGLARLAVRWTGLRTPAEKRTFTLTTGFQNYGYVPLPLSMLLFDQATTGVLCVHNVGVETAVWTLGVAVISGAGFSGGWRKVINAPLIAIVAGVALNFAGLDTRHPGVAAQSMLTTIHMLAQCAIPLGIVLIGATIADHIGELHGGGAWRTLTVAAVIRLGVIPLVILAPALWLPGPLISAELKQVLLLEAAMPSAVFPIILSKHYGGDPPTALRVVLGTQLLGLLTIPLWIRLGGHGLGLW